MNAIAISPPVLALFAVLVAGCASSPPPPPVPSPPVAPAPDPVADRRAIEQVDARGTDALRRGDLAGWAAQYAPDGEFLASESAEPVRGRAAIAAMLQPIAGKVKDLQFTVQELEVHGDVAYEIGAEGGTLVDGGGWRGRAMAIWRRQPDGQWLIARSIFQHEDRPPAPDAHEKRVAEVRRKIEEAEASFLAAIKRADVATATALYTPDAVLLPEGGEAVRGREAITADFAWMARVRVKEWTASIEDLQVSGGIAVETGWEEMTLEGPKQVPRHLKYIDVWKEQPDGSWLIYRDMFNGNGKGK
jgi:uncharacterized protein (TIGR02246 family)